MTDLLLSNEGTIRLAVFIGILIAMAIWEVSAPKRRIEIPRVIRWTNNLGVVVIDTILVRLTFPFVAVGLALMAKDNGWGLFNIIEAPVWVAIIVSVIVLDFAIYLQHVLFHAVPALWRIHRMHHADQAIDVTTGLRFHPVEILLSMGIKLGVVLALGPPAVAVLVFEVLLNAMAMFNHSNVRIPKALDRVLRIFVVTPDMHRVHHSVIPKETDSNFGFNISLWDRMLGTYIAQPREGHEGMAIGIEQFRRTREQWMDKMLTQPFRGPAHGADPRDRRDPRDLRDKSDNNG